MNGRQFKKKDLGKLFTTPRSEEISRQERAEEWINLQITVRQEKIEMNTIPTQLKVDVSFV